MFREETAIWKQLKHQKIPFLLVVTVSQLRLNFDWMSDGEPLDYHKNDPGAGQLAVVRVPTIIVTMLYIAYSSRRLSGTAGGPNHSYPCNATNGDPMGIRDCPGPHSATASTPLRRDILVHVVRSILYPQVAGFGLAGVAKMLDSTEPVALVFSEYPAACARGLWIRELDANHRVAVIFGAGRGWSRTYIVLVR